MDPWHGIDTVNTYIHTYIYIYLCPELLSTLTVCGESTWSYTAFELMRLN